MAIDLDDQLVSYFEWLERRGGMPMHRPVDSPAGTTGEPPARSDDVAEVRVLESEWRRGRARSWWAYAGAASLVAGLAFGITVLGSGRRNTGRTSGSTPSAASTTPTSELEGSPDGAPTEPTSTAIADAFTPGATEVLPVSPLRGRIDPMAVWTGSRMIIWGGSAPKPAGGETPFDDGAIYDPVARSWTTLPPAPISARSNAATVWTGTEMLVWGGSDNGTSLPDGAAFNPTTNTWRQLPAFDLASTIRPTTVWTGTEMFVLEGINGSPNGGAYNPATDTWRTIATPPGRSATPYPQAVWTGSEVIATLTAGTFDTPIIAAYDPTADSWEELATDMGSGQRPKLLWTGTEVLAFGMTDTGGSAWNPTTRTWRTTATAPTNAALGAQPVWTGALAAFWNGGPSITTYDPGTDTWSDTPGGELTQTRSDGASRLWADGILLTWGGFVSNSDGTATGANDGIAWRPKSGTSSAPAVLDDTLGAALPGRVLATYSVGDGVGQLGWEGNASEPLRPWAPVVTADGTILVADPVNLRWQLFRNGVWTAVPYRSGELVVESPHLAPDGLLYALVADDFIGHNSRLVSYDPTDLTLVTDYGAAPIHNGSVGLHNGHIQIGGVDIVDLGDTGSLPGEASWNNDWKTNRITLTLNGVSRAFQLPASWSISGDVVALDDGSIILRGLRVGADGAPNEWFLLRLRTDGSAFTGALPTRPLTVDLDGSFTAGGFIQLEDGQIVEYDLPD